MTREEWFQHLHRYKPYAPVRDLRRAAALLVHADELQPDNDERYGPTVCRLGRLLTGLDLIKEPDAGWQMDKTDSKGLLRGEGLSMLDCYLIHEYTIKPLLLADPPSPARRRLRGDF